MLDLSIDANCYPPEVSLTTTGTGDNGQLPDFIRDSWSGILAQLTRNGVLLFRDVAATQQEFERVCRAGTPNLLDYTAGGSPRTRVKGKVYTSTEYPREQPIPLHCEMTYLKDIPNFLWFWCEQPAEEGGETPIGDMSHFLERMDDCLVEKFDRLGVRYIYNLHGGRGFGRGWKEAFGTDDREQVEDWLTKNASQFSWEADSSLHAELQGPGLRSHSVTGEVVWGNQAASWHIGALAGQMAQRMRRVYRDDSRLPKHSMFGDGSPIPDSDIRRILDGLADEEQAFGWRRGDVLLCDNQRCAHGRRPFTGERRVLVALA